MLVDTHCHLDADVFGDDLPHVLARAEKAGVHAFISIGVGDITCARAAVNLAAQYPNIFATVGVHPHDAAECTDDVVKEIHALALAERVVAIGEIGLDYHYDSSPRDVQRDVFRRFIGLARQLKKPIVVHTRSAKADTLEILRSEKAADVGGVIHCFSEDREFAEAALDLDFDVSFSGIVTFKNARSVQDVAVWAPIERVLVETDSPYLAPVPVRGKKCEPAFVAHTARRVAELRGISFEVLARRTSENAAKRFRAPLAQETALRHDHS